MHENPRIRIDDAWPDDSEHLDDFMATDVAMVHFEALDQSQWYMTIELKDGQVWQLHFGARNSRAQGYAQANKIGASRRPWKLPTC
jgi:hypothetical protein